MSAERAKEKLQKKAGDRKKVKKRRKKEEKQKKEEENRKKRAKEGNDSRATGAAAALQDELAKVAAEIARVAGLIKPLEEKPVLTRTVEETAEIARLREKERQLREEENILLKKQKLEAENKELRAQVARLKLLQAKPEQPAFSIDTFFPYQPQQRRRASLETEKDVPRTPITRSALRQCLKFVNREESINILLKHAAEQYAMYLRGFREKEAQFAACSGGPGLGKTTFCRKAFSRAVDEKCSGKSVWEGVGDEFQGVVTGCVNSGRQYCISFGDVPFQIEEKKDPSKSFALRLMNLCGAAAEWKQLPEGDGLLPEVIKRLTDSTPESLVVVNLDETNKLMEMKGGADYLKFLLSAIRQFNALRFGFVYLILSGTNVRQLHDTIQTETGRLPKEIPLPLLQVEHMQEVLLDLQKRQQEVKTLGPQLDFVLEVLGGVPRYVEMLALLLGQENNLFSHERYCAMLVDIRTKAPSLLVGVRELIKQQYGGEFAVMLQYMPGLEVVSHSLFGWKVSRDTSLGAYKVGDLEARGCVFLTGDEPEATLHFPLVLLLFIADCVAEADPPMWIKHFDVVLSPDQNERASLALLALKCAALAKLKKDFTVADLFGRNIEGPLVPLKFDEFVVKHATKWVTRDNWKSVLQKWREHGAFVVNCSGAPFADMIIVSKGGEFVIFLQEKQREVAKRQRMMQLTVPTLSLESVQQEHAKCNVDTPHLFVLITDERFEAYDKLKPNEFVLPYDQHAAVMGPLLALLRRFNHSNDNTIEV